MTVRVAINGFGRIGRLTLRALAESGRDDIQVVAINTPGAIEGMAHLFTYDSTHGTFSPEPVIDGNMLDVGTGPIRFTNERDPLNCDWGALDIDVVMECTGIFTTQETAGLHLQAGAKKVLISAPGKDSDATIVYGVNHGDLRASHKIVSNASCTTNCLAPVAMVLHEAIGIEQGIMTTVHAYTGDQNILDNRHKDLRRARAGARSIVPTSTGAARAVGLVLPELKGKLDGSALRIPTENVSLVDLTFTAARATSADEVNKLLSDAANGRLKGVLGINSKPLVSIDFNHDPHSSVADLSETKVLGDKLVRVVAWYDNEWGFSCRMLDTAVAMMHTN